jgi:penicillin-binding protein 1C
MPSSLWKSSFLFFVCVNAQAALPDFHALRASYVSSEGRLLDRKGELLQEVRISSKGRALGWVSLEKVSPVLPQALLAVEDKRFFEHQGVDFKAVAAALWQNTTGGTRRGASTITMQLANHLEPELKGKKSFRSKIRQAKIALDLEKQWTKPQILEAYLNLVTFRGEHVGLAAASRALFNQDPHGLGLKESYLLAALLKSPGMPSLQAGNWLCVYAEQNPALGDCESLRDFAKFTLDSAPGIERRARLSPHLARQLVKTASTVRSSLEADLQRRAIGLLREQVAALGSQNARDGAVVVLDNATGEVLAYVGSSGNASEAGEVDMALSRRQAGSTLKPFLYATALEKKYLTTESWLLDEPFEVAVEGRGAYRPENYDKTFKGPVTVGQALGSSLNIPAVRVVELLGVEPFWSALVKLGFSELKEAEEYGASLSLGTADVNLLELANAYRALANGGEWAPSTFGAKSKGKRRVFRREVAEEISAILASRENRALTFGWDSLLSTPYGTAVKTGTSKDMRDNWCIGYSRHYTVAVWMGNSGGEPMWQVSGVSGAAPIWRGLMDHLHRNRYSAPYLARAAKPQKFHRAQFGKILYPVAGAILALDPDIPPGRELVQVEIEGEGVVKVNNEVIAGGRWVPRPGKHILSLLKGEQILDQIQVEVR